MKEACNLRSQKIKSKNKSKESSEINRKAKINNTEKYYTKDSQSQKSFLCKGEY